MLVAMGYIYLYVAVNSPFLLSLLTPRSLVLSTAVFIWPARSHQRAASAPWWRDLPSRLIQSLLVLSVTESWHMGHNFQLQTEHFWLQQVLHSEALGHLHIVRGICSLCAVVEMNRAEPISADSGWDPAFPMSFWDEVVQQLAEWELPAFESSTPKLSWTVHQPCAQGCRCQAHQAWTHCTVEGVPLLTPSKLIHHLFDRTYELSKDSLPSPIFKEAKEIIILSGLSCKGDMLSFLAILRRENKPGDCC